MLGVVNVYNGAMHSSVYRRQEVRPFALAVRLLLMIAVVGGALCELVARLWLSHRAGKRL